MASTKLQATEEESYQAAKVPEIIDLVNAGRKHFAEEGNITRGNYFYNGRRQPGTRNAGTRSKYYKAFNKAPSGFFPSPKESRPNPPPVSRPQYRRAAPRHQRLPPSQLDVIGELEPPTARAVQVWESIMETHRQHLAREAQLAASGEVAKESEKETVESNTVSGGNSGKDSSEEIKGRESRFEDSSSSSEDEVDATGDLGIRGGKRMSFRRAFGYRGKAASHSQP